MRHDARAIFAAALRAADPRAAVERELRRRNFARFERVIVIGCGKATAAMAEAAERVLGRRISDGWINIKDGHTGKLRGVHQHEAGHPVPDQRGIEGARRILQLAQAAGPRDLVLALISGGGSALMPLPVDGITLAEKQETTKLLLACGASIHEINCVRKHLSAIKGGQLARAAFPANVLALMLSDVVGDPLDVIASGPTAPDPSTFSQAQEVLMRRGIWKRCPASVRRHLTAAACETPKRGEACFRRVTNVIVGSNRLAVEAAVRAARVRGYRPLVLSTTIEGETRDVAAMHAAILRECLSSGRPLKPPLCLISGGETTVTLRGDGKGGRNQEFVLAAALELAGRTDICILSGGTDGTDGPTDAAGAISAGGTPLRLVEPARAALNRNDSYHFFQQHGGLLITGPTGTNVMDVRLLLAR